MGSASVNTDERIAKYLEMVADQIRCGFLKFATLRIHEQKEGSISLSLDTYKNLQEQKDEQEFIEKVNEEEFIGRIIKHLNTMLEIDPRWIKRLMISASPTSEATRKTYGVSDQAGLLGFLETLIGPTQGKGGRIAAIVKKRYDTDQLTGRQYLHQDITEIIGFKRFEANEKAPAVTPAPLITEADQHP